MDVVSSIQQRLHEIRLQHSDLGHDYEGMSPEQIANNIIADVMNQLETLFVMINLPADGFVSITPERPDGEQTSSS